VFEKDVKPRTRQKWRFGATLRPKKKGQVNLKTNGGGARIGKKKEEGLLKDANPEEYSSEAYL